MTRVLIAFPRELLDAIDKWRGVQPGVPNRSEAIRRMVIAFLRERGLMK